MEPLIFYSLIASSLVFLIAIFKSKTSKKQQLPPGPPRLPIIGNLHQLGGPDPNRLLRKLGRKYGGIMYLQLGQLPTVVISTPKYAQVILKTHDHVFANRPSSEASDLFFYKSQNMAWAPYGNYWKQMRKISATELLSAQRTRAASFIRDQELTHLRNSLESLAGKPTELREMVVQYVNNVILRSSVGDIHKEQATLIQVLFDIMIAVIQFNAASFFPSANHPSPPPKVEDIVKWETPHIPPTNKFINVITGKRAQWENTHKKFDTILQDILEQHRKNKKSGDQEDLVDVMLRVQNSADLDMPITDIHVKALLLDMLVAGTSAASMATEWAMTEMLRQPHILKRAQEEVRATVKGNKITDADIQNMHYLKMIMNETFRLHGPPLLMPRENYNDCTIDGYHIPANTRVIVNALAVNTDPDSWEDPDSFIPERFEKSSINYWGSNFEFLPFGGGRRVCPGITFGVGIVENAIATMLYYFDWDLADGLKPHEIDVSEASSLSVVPKNPTRVIPIIVSPKE